MFIPVETATAPGEEDMPGNASIDDLALRIRALEDRDNWRAMSTNSEDANLGEERLNEPEEGRSAPLSRDEALDALRRHRDELEGSFRSERVDPSWAPYAQEDYARVLADASNEGEFSVESVECRTTRCQAVLRLGSEGPTAKYNAENIVLRQEYAYNCTTHMYEVPEELGGDQSQLFVQWDCANER